MNYNTPEILKFFPEIVFKYKLENFKNYNKELSEFIYNLYKKDKEGIIRSNRGGWHSKNFELIEKNSIQNKFALVLQNYILNTFQNFGWKTEIYKPSIYKEWLNQWSQKKHKIININLKKFINSKKNRFISKDYD